ncbi:MAG: DMT family transporter [Candidatus Uhrbacteria bacterium]
MRHLESSGVKLALATAVISGFAVFVNKFGVTLWGNPFTYTAAKNIVAALALGGLLLGARKLPELRRLTRRQWGQLTAIGLIGGSVPFLMFFKALSIMPATEAAFIHKTLFLWVALLAVPLLKERVSRVQALALAVLFGGVWLFGAPTAWSFSLGTALALGATVLWAIESVIAKITLRTVAPSIVAWARMAIGSLFLLGFLAATGQLGGVIPTSASQLGWTLIVGLALFGYVATWYRALATAPATLVASVLVLAAPLTAILNSLYFNHAFPGQVVVPIAMMAVGIAIFLKKYLHARRDEHPGTITVS